MEIQYFHFENPERLGVKVASSFDARETARAVLYMASLPLDTNIQFLTIMATKMPFIGRG